MALLYCVVFLSLIVWKTSEFTCLKRCVCPSNSGVAGVFVLYNFWPNGDCLLISTSFVLVPNLLGAITQFVLCFSSASEFGRIEKKFIANDCFIEVAFIFVFCLHLWSGSQIVDGWSIHFSTCLTNSEVKAVQSVAGIIHCSCMSQVGRDASFVTCASIRQDLLSVCGS